MITSEKRPPSFIKKLQQDTSASATHVDTIITGGLGNIIKNRLKCQIKPELTLCGIKKILTGGH